MRYRVPASRLGEGVTVGPLGAEVAPERSIIMPCLHDEPYAHLGVVGATLSSVAGLWFLSEPEHQLAHRVAPV